MDYHQNARLTVHSREQLARKVLFERCTLKLAAASFNVSAKTAANWVRRYGELGVEGLADRSSRPHRLHRPTRNDLVQRIELLRRQRWTGHRIAQAIGLSRAAGGADVRAFGTRHGLGLGWASGDAFSHGNLSRLILSGRKRFRFKPFLGIV